MSPKRKISATYIILAVFILLATYVYVFERDDRPSTDKIKLFDLKKDNLRRIELINNETKETVLFEKAGEEWKMIKPKQYEMEKNEFEGIINNVASLSVDRKIQENAEDFKPYGLDKPAFRVNFISSDHKNGSLLIGAKNPNQMYYYVRDEAKKDVYTAYTYSVDYLKKSAKQLRKKTVAEFEAKKAIKLVIKADKKEVTLAKENDRWYVMPYKFPCDPVEVENILNKVRDLRISDFIEDEPADIRKYALDTPRVTVSVYVTAESPLVTLFVGKKVKDKEEDYAKKDGNPNVFSIDKTFATGFNKSYNDFRDKKLFAFNANAITEVEVVKDGKKINARKNKAGKYEMDLPVKKAEDSQFTTLVSDLSDLKTSKFVDDSGKRFDKYGLSKPKFTVTLYSGAKESRKEEAALFTGNKEKDEYYVRITGSDSVFFVSKGHIEKIEAVQKFADIKK